MEIIKKPKGTQDFFGEQMLAKRFVESKIISLVKTFNFKEVQTPTFESQKLFKRTIGLESDIVTKEMYDFLDKNDRPMTLRPEGTAPIVRMMIENKLLNNADYSKVYYLEQMFRYERPQKNRFREFTQFGIEWFGDTNFMSDVETIVIGDLILKDLNIDNKLIINSIGTKEVREKYVKELKKYLSKFKKDLSEDSLRRLETNPLRILDDKIESKKAFMKDVPKIDQFYDIETKERFEKVIQELTKLKINFEINPFLVRGLDYYNDTIFEFVSKKEQGSQNTLIAGGRYNSLIGELGHKDVGAIGFAIGIERIVNEMEMKDKPLDKPKKIFIANLSDATTSLSFELFLKLRENKKDFQIFWNNKPTNLKKIFDKTKKLEIHSFIILGEKELKNQLVTVKNKNKQEMVKLDNLINFLEESE